MITIAITGGIGSGKSTVTNYLRNEGYIVVDADAMARELTEANGRAIPYIIEHFGSNYIAEDGSMDREKMRNLIFNNPEAKAVLEEGTTKVVLRDIENIKNNAESAGERIMFFDIPLLFELNTENDYDKVWVVSSDLDIRKERIKQRDGIDDKIIDLIIGSQTEEDYRLSKADNVIYNNGSLEELYKNIDSMLKDVL